MASTIDLRITKERYVEMLREFKARHPSMDRGDMCAYAMGHLRAVAVREGHTEEVDILDAAVEVLSW